MNKKTLFSIIALFTTLHMETISASEPSEAHTQTTEGEDLSGASVNAAVLAATRHAELTAVSAELAKYNATAAREDATKAAALETEIVGIVKAVEMAAFTTVNTLKQIDINALKQTDVIALKQTERFLSIVTNILTDTKKWAERAAEAASNATDAEKIAQAAAEEAATAKEIAVKEAEKISKAADKEEAAKAVYSSAARAARAATNATEARSTTRVNRADATLAKATVQALKLGIESIQASSRAAKAAVAAQKTRTEIMNAAVTAENKMATKIRAAIETAEAAKTGAASIKEREAEKVKKSRKARAMIEQAINKGELFTEYLQASIF